MDVEVINTGGPGAIILMRPVTQAGTDWMAENLPEDALWWGGAVAVEGNYADPIIEAMLGDGLEVG